MSETDSFETTGTTAHKAGIGRRLAALFYDWLLVFSLLFFATAILLPFTGGHEIEPGNPLYTAYAAYLTGLSYVYFGLSWTRGGQTLGMRAWQIKALSTDGTALDWRQSLVRFASAFAGLGLLGMVLSPSGNAWHDTLSNSVTIALTKK